MFGSKRDRQLRRLFSAPAKDDPEPDKALEQRLMARFDMLHPRKEKVFMARTSLFVRKILAASAAVAILGIAACVAPVDMDVELGRHLTIQYQATEQTARPDEIAEALRGIVPDIKGVKIRAMQKNGEMVVDLEIWSDSLPEGSLVDAVKAKLPSLATATIQEESLTGKVHGTLGAKLGHDLLDLDVLDTDDVETARQKLMEQLAARGVEGKVDVQVEGDGHERKVKIRVEQEECDPDTEAAPAPPAESSH